MVMNRRNEYSGWYSTREWRAKRDTYLRLNCWCKFCSEIGMRTKATVIDHIKPHKGNLDLFWSMSNWQPLCKPCHDSTKARFERSGVMRQPIGVDGWPLGEGGN